jgi:alkylation response protein AidB-like acyl-CoA dehydrogenase
MNFSLTENQLMIQQMTRDFAQKEVLPYRNEWDEKEHFPIDILKKAGALGLLGVVVPIEYGGSGMGYLEYVTVLTELGKVCGGFGLSIAAHNSLCTGHILQHGNEEQKLKFLPKLATGEHIGAWGLTEPNTGSDAMRMQCVAKKEGNEWVINGMKTWITHGLSADVFVILVRTGDLLDSNGISAFIIEKGTPGLSANKITQKVGVRCSETAELYFDNVRIPEGNLIGKEGYGFKQAMKVLDGGRISIAALSLGVAKGAYESSLAYAKQREQFGKPISSFQAIAFKLADMATECEAAELLCLQAADMKNRGENITKQGAFAKYYASEIAVKNGNEAMQIMGGNGYTKEYPAEKYLRDARLMVIGEGTSEIQKLVISRELLK